MKRILTILLAACLLMCLIPFSAFAVDESRSYELELTVNGSDEVRASPGDILTVNVTLRRTDSGETAAMYAMQDEIRYDDEFLQVMEGSVLTFSGIQTTDMALMDGDRTFYVNFLSLSGGTNWNAEILLATFQIKVLGEKGCTTLKNENALVSTRDGSDSYQMEVHDLLIIVTDECTVRFDSCGGSEVADQNLRIGDRVQKPTDPTREGYVFGGWYTEPELETLWDFDSDTVRGDMTLYAAWETASAPAEPDSGSWWWLVGLLLLILLLLLLLGKKKVRFMVDDTVYHTEKVMRGDRIILPVDPRKPGFRFNGWSDSPEGGRLWNTEEDEVQKSMKLYAQWSHMKKEDM